MRRAAHLDVIGVGVLRKPDLAGRIFLDDLSPAQKPLMSLLIHGETSQGKSALSLRPGYSQGCENSRDPKFICKHICLMHVLAHKHCCRSILAITASECEVPVDQHACGTLCLALLALLAAALALAPPGQLPCLPACPAMGTIEASHLIVQKCAHACPRQLFCRQELSR